MIRALTFAVLFTLACLFGCAANNPPAAPAPVEQHLNAPTNEIFSTPIDSTEAAVTAALKSMRLVIVDRRDIETGRLIEAQRSDNSSVFVTLVPLAHGTQVGVRVGLYGDVAAARQILDAVRARLPQPEK